MKRILFITFFSLSFLYSTAAIAQEVTFPWLRTSHGAASAGMADAGILTEENMAWAAFGQSAMAVLSDNKFSADITYSLWQPSPSHQINVGLSGKAGKRIVLCGGLSTMTMKAYTVYNEVGSKAGKFAPLMLEGDLGCGVRLTDFMGIGINARYGMESLSKNTVYNAIAGDLMVAFKYKGFVGNIAAMNLGVSLNDVEKSLTKFPSSAKLTLGYDDRIAKESLRLAAFIDADYYFNKSCTAAFGAAIGYKDYATIRGGYRYSTKTAPLPSYATIGAGFSIHGVMIDFTYYLASDMLSNSIQASLGFRF